MPSNQNQKIFQPDSDGPDAKLEFSSSGHGTAYLWVLERDGGEWTKTGSVEMHPAMPLDCRGVCSPGDSILEWAYTEFHASGDRVKVGNRLLLFETDDGIKIERQKEREEVLGFGNREEHRWRTVESWKVSPEGAESIDVETDRV